MNQLCDHALQFLERLEELYYIHRDMEGVLALLDPQVTWIGTGAHESGRGQVQSRDQLLAEMEMNGQGIQILSRSHETVPIDENTCLVFGIFQIREQDETGLCALLDRRISALIGRTAEGLRVKHLHLSTPDRDQLEGEFYPRPKDLVTTQQMQEMIEEKSRQIRESHQDLAALTANIPGGVQRCLNDDAFTIIYLSDGFVSLFGYSREEIREQFHNQYLQMVLPEDREAAARTIQEQLRHGDTINVEYRVRHQDGRIMWVLDKGQLVRSEDGQETFYCVMVDITRNRWDQEELRLSEERHRIIMDQTTDILFEWKIASDQLLLSSNWEKKFGYPPIRQEISHRIPLSENIHPSDMRSFVGIMEGTAQGAAYLETEFRIRKISGEYLWCRIRATTQFDEDGRPYKVVGVILDIDEEKKRSEKLLEMAEKDGLTLLLNKETMQKRAEEFLALAGQHERHALFIIDIDNFKQVNDQTGHLAGDRVLAAVARDMRRLFRTSDLLGRVGGDEFAVLIKDIPFREAIADKAAAMVAGIAQMSQELGLSCPVTASIGISLYPEDGCRFSQLYESADQALYCAKRIGKARYCFGEKE